MAATDNFQAAIERAEHLITLYDLLHDTRTRRVRADWSSKFKKLMRWPDGEQICRIDGAGKNSMLILRESVDLDNSQFSHDYLTELLRSAVVAAISALDRYLHDLVVENCWKLLSKAEDQIPAELKKIKIPLMVTKKSIEKLRQSTEARPGTIVKKAIQEQLHREFTFQKPDSVIRASKMLGITDFWRRVSAKMDGSPSDQQVKKKLTEIADRRNQIVHEADIKRKTRDRGISLRDIKAGTTKDWVAWISDLGAAIDLVVEESV